MELLTEVLMSVLVEEENQVEFWDENSDHLCLVHHIAFSLSQEDQLDELSSGEMEKVCDYEEDIDLNEVVDSHVVVYQGPAHQDCGHGNVLNVNVIMVERVSDADGDDMERRVRDDSHGKNWHQIED